MGGNIRGFLLSGNSLRVRPDGVSDGALHLRSGGALRVGSFRVFVVLLLSFALILTEVSGFAFADGISLQEVAIPKLPDSNLSDDLAGKVVGISPKSYANRILSIKESSRDAGVPVAVDKNKKAAMGQHFEICKSGADLYIIRSAHTGRLVSEADGKIVQTGMTSPTDDAQRWAVTKHSGGYIFTNAATGRRISASKSSVGTAAPDAKITDSQIFKIKLNPIKLDGYHTFVTESGNAIALQKDSIKNGAGMSLKKDVAKSTGRQFLLTSSDNGYHSVKSSISFKALSVKDDSKKEDSRLIQREYEKSKGQRFKLVPSGDGWYLIKSELGPYVSATSDKAGRKLVTINKKSDALKVRVRQAEYSSGIPKLDAQIKKIHKKIGSSGNMMRKSFNYVVSHYRHREHPNDFSGDWIARYAWYMMSKKYGHCKNFAATLCVLLRSYGYDARVVTGYVPSRSRGWAVHGWVEAKVGGKAYIFDTDLHVALGNRGWYKRTYANAPVRYRIEKRW